MYDIIGDIHGHADDLVRLLETMGYRRQGQGYRRPDRQVIFVGDFIDRGPRIAESLKICRSMVDEGAALAVMGNHEFNALAFHTPAATDAGEFLRPHTEKNVSQHRATLDQVPPAELRGYLDWFRTLPFALDLDGVRVVHACWDGDAIQRLQFARRELGGVTDEFMQVATGGGSTVFQDAEVVLKGPEASLPDGKFFLDPDGHKRTAIRARWYLPAGAETYGTYALQSEPVDCSDKLTPEARLVARPYAADSKPLFIGHYWLRANRPARLVANVACVDYSVAKGGYLCAYQWDGEAALNDRKFVVA